MCLRKKLLEFQVLLTFAFPSSLFSPGVQRRVSERQSVLSFIHNTQEQLKSDQIDAFNNNKSHLYL